MRILITGNLGYVGSELTNQLHKIGCEVVGVDLNFFKSTLTKKTKIFKQIIKDFRDLNDNDLKDIHAVVHLAAISNDPIGNYFSKITNDINNTGTIKLAKLVKKNKIKKFIFASSCSVYGEGGKNLKSEKSSVNPLSSYAKSKIFAENGLKKIKNMSITSLRFATATGFSDNLRLDLVLNDFIISALTVGKIEILSDGKPIRPLIHVKDMAKAIIWSISRSKKNFFYVNVGSNSNNYSVLTMARIVSKQIPCEIIVKKINSNDKRSYAVNFTSYKNKVPKRYQPTENIEKTISQFKKKIKKKDLLKMKNFRNSKYVRLNILKKLIKKNKITKKLKWKKIKI